VETNRVWNEYNKANQRDESMAHEWILTLKNWLMVNVCGRVPTTILDYGCGYFDLGIELIREGQAVDGFDPFDPAVHVARRRVEELAPDRTQIWSAVAEIPKARYNVIVLNSVVQYMTAANELEKFLSLARDLLRKEGGFIVISDVIPQNYSPVLDGLECLFYAARRGLLWPMILHLGRTFRNGGHNAVKRYDCAELEEFAEHSGYELKKLERNLTPSKRRYSVVFQTAQ
jgi:2-polyprenyl-3-methyl-5-hydroxy-6-metoxy-1,4-benzoquinol methylase